MYLLQTATLAGLSIDTTKIDVEEAYCLAENVYYEARSEDIRGQFAVASVTMNRVNNKRYPNTVCGVVKQTAGIGSRIVCAFSWYCENDRKGKDIPIKNKDGSVNQLVVDQFQVAMMVAITTLGGDVKDITKGATHFHNQTITPQWSSEMRKTLTLGNHTFYR